MSCRRRSVVLSKRLSLEYRKLSNEYLLKVEYVENRRTLSCSSNSSSVNSGTSGESTDVEKFKTEMCNSYRENNGFCRYGLRCKFAHGESEIRTLRRHPKFKTDYCKSYLDTGYCKYGSRCVFIHQSQVPKENFNPSQNSNEFLDFLGSKFLLLENEQPAPRPVSRLPIFNELVPMTSH